MVFASRWRDSGSHETQETFDGLKGMSSARSPRGRTHGSGRSSSAWAWLSYGSRTCFGLERPGRSRHLGMANFASWARSRGVVNMVKTLGHGRPGGCGSSKKNDKNVVLRPHDYQSPADLEEAWVALVAGSELENYRCHCLR